MHEKPFAPGQVAISSGSVTLWASRAPDGRLAVRARADLRVRRPIVAQVTVAPCNAFINPLSATPETPIRVFSGRNLVKSVRLRPGSRTIRLSGRVTSDAAGDPFPRRWTDCAVATVLDEREVGRPSVAVPARQGDALFRSGAVVTLTVTRPDGSIAEV